MNKVIFSVLSILSFLAGLLLLISALLTSEKGLKFILNFDQQFHVDYNLKDSYWHPYKPAIEIHTLSLKRAGEESKFLKINNLKVKFNLFSVFRGTLIESLYVQDINLLIYPYSNKHQTNFSELWSYVSPIKNLKFDEFTMMDPSNNLKFLQGELSLKILESGSSKLRFTTQSKIGGNLDFRMNSILGSKSLKDYKGYLSASNFSLNKDLISQFCLDCPSGILDTKIRFTFIDLKLVKFSGGITFKLNSSIDFINSINANIQLEDPANNIFRISSFINDVPEKAFPDIFTFLNSQETTFFIPRIELGKDKFINQFQHFFDLPKDFLVEGFVRDLNFKLNNSLQFKAGFENISLKSNNFSIEGLQGDIKYFPKISNIEIKTPSLRIGLGNLFDDSLLLNNFSSKFVLKLIDEKVSVSRSSFQGTYKRSLLKGHFDLIPSPFDDSGDLSLSISSKDLNYLDALNLFPNLNSTNLTKNWLQKSISCGSFHEFSFIYRGPIDNNFQDSSSSFQSQGVFKDACLTLNEVDIKEINLVSKINNTSFVGEVLSSDLYGSKIMASINIYKDTNNYRLNIKGKSEGPFLSVLRLSNLDQIFQAEINESGEQNTSFYFTSPLVPNLEVLGNNSEFKLNAKIKDGKFKNKKTNLNFSQLYSSIEYDSTNGVKDTFATIKINDIPLKLSIRKDNEQANFSTQLIAEEIFSTSKILPSFSYKKELKGSSRFKIKLTLPSFIKGQPFIGPVIEATSNLEGISINLPEPIKKVENSKVDFNLLFKLDLNKPPLLNFKYGDLFRGKFIFQDDLTEGFVIAGKKKRNISIVDGEVLLVGELEKLDLDSLISLGIFESKGSGNFYIKDLTVKETNFSNLSLLDTRFKSSRKEAGVEYKFINEDLNGILLIPEKDNKKLSFKFNFIKINLLSDHSKDSFLALYNGINFKFDFSSKAIIFNGQNYGNWEFSVSPKSNQLTIYDIKGTYGKWGVKQDSEGISYLKIIKNPIGWTSNLKTNIYSGSPEKAMLQIGIKPNFELDTVSLDANLAWNDLPWLFDYNSITGEISTNLDGLIIRNNDELETANNLLRLVNIFNITDSFEKVTNLDFRRKFKRGFSADKVRGKFSITNKTLAIEEPILLKSGSSEFNWTGEISRDNKGNLDRLRLEVIMTLPLREYLTPYALVLGGPIAAGVVYIAGKAFERNLDKLSSGKWKVTGNISDPKTEFDGWFEGLSEE